jgi:hypothetical protein
MTIDNPPPPPSFDLTIDEAEKRFADENLIPMGLPELDQAYALVADKAICMVVTVDTQAEWDRWLRLCRHVNTVIRLRRYWVK